MSSRVEPRSPRAHSPCPGSHPDSRAGAGSAAGSPAAEAPMAAMAVRAAALWGVPGRFRWRTQAWAGGVRSASRDTAGRAGSGPGCPPGGCPRDGVPAFSSVS